MIVIGKRPTLSPRREALLRGGSIMTVLEKDRVVAVYAGSAPGVDAIFMQTVIENGVRLLMGRVRIHVDDKRFNSEDHKEVLRIMCSPEIPEDFWNTRAADSVGIMAALGGITDMRVLDLRAEQVVADNDFFEHRLQPFLINAGMDLSIAASKLPPEDPS